MYKKSTQLQSKSVAIHSESPTVCIPKIIVHGWWGGSCTKTNPDLAKTSFRVMLEHCWAHVNAYAERRAGWAGGDLATIWAHVNAYATHWRPFESVIAPHWVYKIRIGCMRRHMYPYGILWLFFIDFFDFVGDFRLVWDHDNIKLSWGEQLCF